jgi:arylsulfatase A-like enzyme
MKPCQDRRTFLITMEMFAVVSLAPMSMAAQGMQPRPNILYIMSDDHAYQAIGAYATLLSDVVRTPNIDRIAKEGIRLDNCFVTNSICTPSRAAILTGQYSHINGVKTFTALDPKRQNVAKLLQKAGYQTAIIGKWHLGSDPTGFDYWNVLPGQGRYSDPTLTEKGSREPKTYQGHSTDVICDLSLNWLDGREPDKPFFLMCHFKAAHADWEPAKRFRDLYRDTRIPEPANLLEDYRHPGQARELATLKLENMFGRHHLAGHTRDETKDMTLEQTRRYVYQQYMKQYLRCIAGIDENVGKLLTYLDKNGLTNNAVVIYTSDQGHFQGEHGFYDKRFMYEETLRMPFLARYPKEINPGTSNADFVINTDFAPLFLDYADQPVPVDMQGRSFRWNMAGTTPEKWRSAMYYRYWLHRAHHGVPAHFGIRTREHKLIFFYGLPMGLSKKLPSTPTWELYDLKTDPSEMRNVYQHPAYASVIKELKQRLFEFRKELKDTDDDSLEMKAVIEKYW